MTSVFMNGLILVEREEDLHSLGPNLVQLLGEEKRAQIGNGGYFTKQDFSVH